MRGARSLLVLTALAAAGVTAVLGIALVRHAAVTDASDTAGLEFRAHPGARLPLEARLIDENGRDVALGSFFARSPVILVLEYLRCKSLCGVTLQGVIAGLSDLPLEPGRDYQLLAISIDPRDHPAELATARETYLSSMPRDGAASGVHFLGAHPAAVRDIAESMGFSYRYVPALDEYIHPAGFVVATPKGVISRAIEGAGVSRQELVTAIAAAEQDNTQDLLTQVVLFCHVQGLPLGRYTVPILAIFTAANVVAGFTSIAIFGAVRRRRHG